MYKRTPEWSGVRFFLEVGMNSLFTTRSFLLLLIVLIPWLVVDKPFDQEEPQEYMHALYVYGQDDPITYISIPLQTTGRPWSHPSLEYVEISTE